MIFEDGLVVAYAELLDRSEHFAAYLAERVEPGDAVAADHRRVDRSSRCRPGGCSGRAAAAMTCATRSPAPRAVGAASQPGRGANEQTFRPLASHGMPMTRANRRYDAVKFPEADCSRVFGLFH
jgi:hypothetical protein